MREISRFAKSRAFMNTVIFIKLLNSIKNIPHTLLAHHLPLVF